MRTLVNLNDIVKVQLTDRGREVLDQYITKSRLIWTQHTKYPVQFSLSFLMTIFGGHMTTVRPGLFENDEIELP